MSLVGPRPEQIHLAEKFNKAIPEYHLRHLVRPGITGWAQINVGDETTIENTRKKLTYDLYYIRNRSIFFDIKILFKTILFVIRQ